jgi:hypothetical protein
MIYVITQNVVLVLVDGHLEERVTVTAQPREGERK